MLLYLVQHAESKTKEEDPERPLSERGLQEIRKVARQLAALKVGVSEIHHSTKLRAKQTAEVLSGALRPGRGLRESDGLSPLDDPGVWAERLQGRREDLMLVGHLPHLERLASLLLCGEAGRRAVAFRTAGVVCLERDDTGVWSVHWVLRPEMVSGGL